VTNVSQHFLLSTQARTLSLASVARMSEEDARAMFRSIPCGPPDGDVFAVKAIVPGLECETMSYHRIGERGIRRLLERGSELAGIGAAPPGMRAVPLTKAAMERLGGPAWLDTGAIDRIVGPLYALYREPESHAVRFALGE